MAAVNERSSAARRRHRFMTSTSNFFAGKVLRSFTLWVFILPCITAQDSANNTTNGTNSTPNCTDNFTAVNVANYTGLPLCPEVPPPPCYTDHCWGTIAREARNSCMELTTWGADAARCAFFQTSASQACNVSCQDCVSIASAMYDECLFTLLAATVNYDDAIPTCQALASDFQNLRCPTALIDVGTCYGANNDACQAECGNWHACDCWKLRGQPGEPDHCVGETVILNWEGVPDNCDAIPRNCFNHRPGTFCAKYKHCPANLCIIKGVTCPLTDTCQNVGVCAPGDGQCYYSTLPDGTPCDDSLFYTHTDTCKSAVCTGIEDKCMRYDVQCNTLNSCLAPTTKVRGACDPPTGSCVFEALPDGTACSSQPGGPVDGTCDAGLCRRTVLNKCAGKICVSTDFCAGVGACDMWTGECVFSPVAEGEACDDGNPLTFRDRCIEGQCIGDSASKPLYAFEGSEKCEGKAGLDTNTPRYFGSVLTEQDCQDQCSQDAWCRAYSYGYYICYIYGGFRTKDPDPIYWGKKWLLLDPAAQPGVHHAISCFSKQDASRPAPFFDETAAWFGLTVVIVVVLPALWGLAMVWRQLSRSFRNLTGCCGGLREDEVSSSKEGWSRNSSKEYMSRSVSQMSFGQPTSKVHNSQEAYLEDALLQLFFRCDGAVER
ncbi:unnamed protein product [Effrenium voratum]|uniref:Apple domain-containing protein n=1 Tax=Effrenium voratum TaxID=2562239 RepID=A0AA36ITK9_9DINO|nr:unnamed protein product [Effrenium voratum]CAJ1412602.1 unnamed protein product [Effrenium voratum]